MKRFLVYFFALVLTLLQPIAAHASYFPETKLAPPSNTATYQISAPYITPATSPTDIFQILGSSTKTVEILKVWISLYADNGGGTTANCAVYLLKRSTAGSGGTSTAITPLPSDSSDGAATCSAKYFTANPTVGTLVGQAAAYNSSALYSAGGNAIQVIYEAPITGKPIVLRGTSENVVINLGGTTIYTGGKVMVNAIIRER